MLQHVRVQNIALIDEAAFDLDQGLNVLTGETGAGKSILLGAIHLALGSRAGKDIIRDTARGASVDLLFSDVAPKVLEELEKEGIFSENGEVLVSRRFTPSGRSACVINDCMVTAVQVKKIASMLIDIHGQHEHQSLLDAGKHIELLDRFIPEMPSLLKDLRSLWDESESIRKELAFYEENGRDRARMLSLMEFEINEIEETSWQDGEEESLAEEKKRLMYAERLQRSALEAASMMNGDSSSEGALSLLDNALSKMRSASSYDEEFFGPYIESMQEQLSVLEDIAAELRDYGEGMEADPERLNTIEDRISAIYHLKEKYGRDREQVLQYLTKRQDEFEKLKNLEATTEKLRQDYDKLHENLEAISRKMTTLRVNAGKRIEKQITEVLSTLQFEDPLFEVSREEKKLSPNGSDTVVFLIRTNVGEKIMPLNKIASGGEMSRVMLAIKTVLAAEDEIGTMIFDEIDTGISGRTAQSVAEKMSRIAAFHQVICVTHLPQIAAMADNHLRIEKASKDGHTSTRIYSLEMDEVAIELSRMLGGSEITEAVKENAMEMKRLANERKKTWMQ